MKHCIFILFFFCLTACSVYSPTSTPIIYTENKGDLQLNGTFEAFPITGPVNFMTSVSYAPINNLALNGSLRLRSDFTYQLEGNIGFTKTINSVKLGAFGNYSIGDFRTTAFVWEPFEPSFNGIHNSFGGLLQFGLKTEKIDYFIFGKYSQINWSFNKQNNFPAKTYDFNRQGIALEPGVSIIAKAHSKFFITVDYVFGFYNKTYFERLIGPEIDIHDPRFVPIRNYGNLGVGLAFFFSRK